MKKSEFGTDRVLDTSGHGPAFPPIGSGRATLGTWGQRGLGVFTGGCSEAVDALLERGYTIHVGSLRELRGLL
jgi:hypothetical protein